MPLLNRSKIQQFDDIEQPAGKSLLFQLLSLIFKNKKFWLLPVILLLLIVGFLIVLGSSSIAPFIYPLF